MTNHNLFSEKIKNYINEYDRIYLLAKKDFMYSTFIQAISRHSTEKCLILVVGLEKGYMSKYGTNIRAISYKEYRDIEKLYCLYEFSDRIHILTDNPQYGGLDNYIYNGLLSEEEASMAILK